MAELPALVKDLALILIVAGVVTLVFKRLKQPLVLGYIVAGFLVSPQFPYTASVADLNNVDVWANIGVIFLLFSLGLEFSFKKILKMGLAPVVAACTIIFCMMFLGIGVGHSFGWSRMDCIFLGGMLAMSSTTIIYKAFDDMGLRQQRFAGVVMSVLILEDVLAIVLMVMLSAIAQGNDPDGGEMIGIVLRIGFFLVLWFVVGIFLIPQLLRRVRRIMTDETLLVVALGLCFLMTEVSTAVGFSSAFGAFVMGSILAETVEADKIIKVVEPVKNLFGAIFFVSVGMLVDIQVLINYAWPIVALVFTILVGQALFGSMGYLLSGQTLKTAMQCGFSMAQIGEFAFIIASLGLSLHVVGDFLYPVVVAVSVITTFLTPYMMRFANPCYSMLEKRLSKRVIAGLNQVAISHHSTVSDDSNWRKLLRQMAANTLIYSTLSVAVIVLMFTFVLPFVRSLMPNWHWTANAICGVLTVIAMSPFLRAMVMKKNHSEEYKALWNANRYNHVLLVLTIVVRMVIACAFVFYVCNYLSRFTNALMITIAVALVALMVLSRWLKNSSIRMERMFVQNLRSRDMAAEVVGRRRPLYEEHLLDRDIHMSEIDIPQDSLWGGHSLKELALRTKFGVHVSSILRSTRRINIPDGDTVVFPGDKLQAIGGDSQLSAMVAALRTELYGDDADVEKRSMRLKQMVITSKSAFVGKTLRESGIRDKYNCMVVGLEEGKETLSQVDPSYRFEKGDILWIVGEEADLEAIIKA
jgi:monovalent cation:H+ antiporter-2, CPA2 family